MSSQESLGVTTFEIYYIKEHFVGSLARASKSTCAPIQNELTYLHKAGAEPKQKPIIHVFLHSLAFILTHFLPIHQVPTSSLSLLIQSFCNHLIERKKRLILLRLTSLFCRPSFGIAFDIDGVLLRGDAPIGGSPQALRKLYDDSGMISLFLQPNHVEMFS